MTAAILYFITCVSTLALFMLWIFNVYQDLSRKRNDVFHAKESKEEDPVIYICEDCGFVFYGAGEISECPYCGKQRIHDPSGEEVETLRPFLEWQKTDYPYDQKSVDIM